MGTNNLIKYLNLAKEKSLPEKSGDLRSFYIGAVGIRSDGLIVSAKNLSCEDRCPQAHAEARLARKLDKDSIIFVARVTKGGQIGLAKPCVKCLTTIRNKGVSKVYYTIDTNSFGYLEL